MAQTIIALDDPESYDEEGNTALFKAAYFGNYNMIKRLLTAGANPNEPNRNRITPLMAAASEAHPDVVALLLDSGVSVDARNESGETALLFMARGENSVILEDCINSIQHEYQRKVETDEEISRIRIAYPRIVRLLLAAGSDVNVRDIFGSSPLHNFAAHIGPDCVRLLLEHGAQVNAKDESGETPLMSALFSETENSVNIVKLLLEYGAEVNIENEHKFSALRICAERPGNPKIISLLLASNASRNLAR